MKGLDKNPDEIAALKSSRGKTEEAREGERTRRRLFEEARVAEISSAREDKRLAGWTGKKTLKTNRACEASAADGECASVR